MIIGAIPAELRATHFALFGASPELASWLADHLALLEGGKRGGIYSFWFER